MEENQIEQLNTEPETTAENSESSIYGKFKDAKTLLEAYTSLEAEFTRKSQRLAEIQKNIDEFALLSNNDSLENILNDSTNSDKYKKEITEILENNENISNLPNKNYVAFNIIKEAERRTADMLNNPEYIDKYIEDNTQLKQKILSNYLSNKEDKSSAPKVISGNASSIYISPSLNTPKTLKDAGEILSKMLK